MALEDSFSVLKGEKRMFLEEGYLTNILLANIGFTLDPIPFLLSHILYGYPMGITVK